MENFLEIAQAVLAAVGALKVVARYTPWQWDDRALEFCEKPLSLVLNFFKPKEK